MQVITISREYVKPSNPFLHHLKPYKLCLFDQLTPLTYPAGIIFYPNAKLGHYIDQNHNFNNNNYNGNDNDNNLQEILAQLKKSLSEALNLHYPFAGRIKNNLYVDDFDAGLLYVEARVNCRMSEYFKLRDTESLDHFLPFPPFRKEAAETSSLPQVAFQVVLNISDEDLYNIWQLKSQLIRLYTIKFREKFFDLLTYYLNYMHVCVLSYVDYASF